MFFNRFTAYRNSDEFSNLDLHMRSRTAPLRNRRDLQRIEHQSNVDQVKQSTELTAIDKTGTDGQRNRRDTTECVSNYNADRHLLIGCAQPNIIEVKPQCNQEDEGKYTSTFHNFEQISLNKPIKISVYNCHGTWTENSTTFTVAIHAGSQHGVCITYQSLTGTAARLYLADSCQRPDMLPLSDHQFMANLTIIGLYCK